METWIVLSIGAAFLAWTNGANDVIKGVATLYGSGTASYRAAIVWATLTTAAGSTCAALIAGGLVRAFSAKGLVADSVAVSPPFLIAVVFGAASTVLIATRFGLPISTTHAIVGGLVGAGWICASGAVEFALLGQQFLLPLLASPVLALLLGAGLYATARAVRSRLAIREDACACIEAPSAAVATSGLPLPVRITACTAPEPGLVARSGARLGIRADGALDVLHFLSSGATSFARGLNDAPKIAGLLVVVGAGRVGPAWVLVAIAAVMSIGGWLGARRVAQTVARDITPMNAGQGFAANLATAALVLSASHVGMPVSTTHVSCGALFGIGAVTREADLGTVRKILLAWVFTLPTAAGIAALLAWGLARVSAA